MRRLPAIRVVKNSEAEGRAERAEIGSIFFARDTRDVAKDLLGKIIAVGRCSGRISEVEAYRDDEASHAAHRTNRSEIMFDSFGKVYVYVIYGMYCCLNFTTEDGAPGAVLIRGMWPINGIDIMKKRRGTSNEIKISDGPGRLCQALGIDKSFNRARVGDKIKIIDDGYVPENIYTGPRIGISRAKDLEWRYFLKK